MVFIRSGTVLTDWNTEAFGLPRKYLDSCLPTNLHQPDPEATLSHSFYFFLPLRLSSEISHERLGSCQWVGRRG